MFAQESTTEVSAEAFGLGMIVFGVVTGLILLFWVYRSTRLTGRARGRVFGHSYSSSEDGTTKHSEVEFMIDNVRYEFTDRTGTTRGLHDVGDELDIRFRPGDPSKARVAGAGRTIGRTIGWISLFVTAVGLIAGGVAVRGSDLTF